VVCSGHHSVYDDQDAPGKDRPKFFTPALSLPMEIMNEEHGIKCKSQEKKNVDSVEIFYAAFQE